jgi:hypothetical protein
MNAKVDVFPAFVGLLVETHLPRHSYGNRRLRLQFERAPDDGHNNARNMLSSICATKQLILQLIVASGWVFLFIYVFIYLFLSYFHIP